MQTTVRTLKVFLASPGDVKPERAAAEELVNDLNKQMRDLGWQIMLYMWEDLAPGFGRPQEIINSNVDECTVFLGLLWERWGQATGKYSSGFEEEFERALTRRKATGEPEIWLVFKAPNPDKVKDPGPELSRVLEFRNRQTTLREVLYHEVSDCADWKSKLTNWLWRRVSEQLSQASRSLQPQQPASSPDPQSTEAATPQPTDTEAAETNISHQLLASAASLTKAIKNTELEAARREKGALEEFDVARLFIVAASMMFRWYTGDTLQTHEMNLIYRHRVRLEPIAIEYFQLLRAIVVDASDVVPGWFWFGGMTPETLRVQLLVLADQDSSPEVRRRALWLLREARIALPEYLWVSLPLWESEDSVRAEAYRYLSTIADESALPLLEELSAAEDASISSSAREAMFSLLTRLNPEKAYSQMVETGTYASDAKLSQLKGRASAISDAGLLKGAESQWEHVREFAVKELATRGSLTKLMAEQLTADPSVPIREIAFTELAKLGDPIDFRKVKKALAREKPQANSLAALLGGQKQEEGDADSVILTYYRHQNAELVAAAVEWFDVDGALAYKSLATDHFDAIQGQIRTDLENGFERVKKNSISDVESTFGAEHATGIVERFKVHDDFIRSLFVEAALAGLAVNGDASDIRFGRQYLATDSPDTKLAAVRIICRFGTEEDVPALLNVAKDSWGEARDEAGACALHLSSNRFEVARELIQSRSSELVHTGYTWLYDQNSREVADFFEALLDSGDGEERLRSVYYLSRTRKSEDLEKALEANLQKEKYFYNVVAWLDRLLYSPEPLRSFFIRKLAEEASAAPFTL
jgi:HEAT repeat protein